jgi:hypothetical protein
MVVPLHNSLLKLLKQSEVYLMEEAVTDQILKSSASAAVAGTKADLSQLNNNNESDALDVAGSQENTRRQQREPQPLSAYEKALNPKMPNVQAS